MHLKKLRTTALYQNVKRALKPHFPLQSPSISILTGSQTPG